MSHPTSRRVRPPRAGRRRRPAIVAILVAVSVFTAACADFSTEQPSFGAQPSLTPPAADPVQPQPSASASASPSPSPSSPGSSSPGSSGASSSAPEDPCRPSDPAVIAACLKSPWGLALLPGDRSALVGERTTGRILTIAPQQEPIEYATIPNLDASGRGGLLGIALSPAFSEDGLIYAYVTTAKDNRVIRIAEGDSPKAILTGIPKGENHNGGRIAFGTDDQLYIGTGDTGRANLAVDPKSLAGKVLRVDEFGKPSKGNSRPDSPVYASGFTDVTGMCSLGTGVAALDHRAMADVLIGVKAGGTYQASQPHDAVWRWTKSEGGSVDCARSTTQLGFTSLAKQRVVGIGIDRQGGFTGTPQTLLEKTYGRLLTLEVGGLGTDRELFWATTSNKDGAGKPTASDDRVVVIPAGGGGGDGGPD